MQVGMVGLGRMGATMAERLWRGDHEVIGYDRNPEVSEVGSLSELEDRLGSALYERAWNRESIDHVQITLAESLGVEGRGAFYKEAGALRDSVQNHVFQALSLLTMEPPVSLAPEAIRDEKSKVFSAMRPLDPTRTVRSQYVAGTIDGKEEGLFLLQFAKKIRIIEYSPQLNASPLLQDKVLNHPQFEVHRNTQVTEFQGDGKLSAVVAKDRATGEERVFSPAAAFVYIGLDPNTSFLKSAIELDQWGFIATNEALQTSLPGVFAAGDVRAGSTKQLASAIGEGVTGLLMVRQYLQRHSHLRRAQAA